MATKKAAAPLQADLVQKLAGLTEDLIATRVQLKSLTEHAIDLELQIGGILGEPRSGSSQTFYSGNWRYVLKKPLYRTIDEDKWVQVKNVVARNLLPVKEVLSESALSALKKLHPQVYNVCDEAIKKSPGKLSVTITAAAEPEVVYTISEEDPQVDEG